MCPGRGRRNCRYPWCGVEPGGFSQPATREPVYAGGCSVARSYQSSYFFKQGRKHVSNESSGAPKNEQKIPLPLSCLGPPGQARGRGRTLIPLECEFRTALFTHLLGKPTCPVTFTLYKHGRTIVKQLIQRCRCWRTIFTHSESVRYGCTRKRKHCTKYKKFSSE